MLKINGTLGVAKVYQNKQVTVKFAKEGHGTLMFTGNSLSQSVGRAEVLVGLKDSYDDGEAIWMRGRVLFRLADGRIVE